MRRLRVLALFTVVLFGTTVLQADDNIFSVILRGSYTTSSKVFFNPNASTEELRGQFFQLDGITGWGAEVRYRFPGETFFLTLSADYFSKTREQDQIIGFVGPERRFPVADGFTLIPVELGVYTYIPLGSETMRLSMGGGLGVYYGKRILRVAEVDAVMQNSPINLGIHISSGVEYQVYPGILLRGDMKFRDPELKTVNRYTQDRTTYDGVDLAFPRNDISGRVNINGLTFSFGVVVELF